MLGANCANNLCVRCEGITRAESHRRAFRRSGRIIREEVRRDITRATRSESERGERVVDTPYRSLIDNDDEREMAREARQTSLLPTITINERVYVVRKCNS